MRVTASTARAPRSEVLNFPAADRSGPNWEEILNYAEGILARLKWLEWSAHPASLGMHAYGYTVEEQKAIDLVVWEAKEIGMKPYMDLAGNVYLVRQGSVSSPGKETVLFLSHLDTVRNGGAYDGRDGVVAGLAVAKVLHDLKVETPFDLVVQICRSEESCVNGRVSLGVELATAQFNGNDLKQLTNSVSGRLVIEHMEGLGLNVDALLAKILSKQPLFPRASKESQDVHPVSALEIHIVQGTNLERVNADLGLVTSIRGNVRYKNGHISSAAPGGPDLNSGFVFHGQFLGEAAHSGATFEEDRADAVRAYAELVKRVDIWCAQARETDPSIGVDPVAIHSSNKSATTVAQDLAFSLRVRGGTEELFSKFQSFIAEQCQTICQANASKKLTWAKLESVPSKIACPSALATYTRLINAAESWYQSQYARRRDVVFTPALVAVNEDGSVSFSFEIRSTEESVLSEFESFIMQQQHNLNNGSGSKVSLPAAIVNKPAQMDPGMIQKMEELARESNIAVCRTHSGAGHDIGKLTVARRLLIFVGQPDPISHNPREAHNEDSFGKSIIMGYTFVTDRARHLATDDSPAGSASLPSLLAYLISQGAREYEPQPSTAVGGNRDRFAPHNARNPWRRGRERPT